MKRFWIYLAVLAIFAKASDNPCEDRKFVKLKKKDLTTMSDEDYVYLDRHDRDCKAWLARTLGGDTIPPETAAPQVKPEAFQPAASPATARAPEPPPAADASPEPAPVSAPEVAAQKSPSLPAFARPPVPVPSGVKVYGPQVAPPRAAMNKKFWHPPMIVPIPKPMPPEYTRPLPVEADLEREKEYIGSFARILGITAGVGITILLLASIRN